MRWHLVGPLGEGLCIVRTVYTMLIRFEVLDTWRLTTTVNMMVTIFQKEQLYLAMHGQRE